MYRVVTPETDEDFEKYFTFRWQMLRKPWNYPLGSEKDEYEQVSHHRMIVGPDKQVLAIGRLHFNTSEEAQMRHIAVSNDQQGKGLGKLIVSALEGVARHEGVERIVTNSRELSMPFFKSCGYVVAGESPTELGSLTRQLMIKQLTELNAIMIHPKWCQALQKLWHEAIPISEQMGIKLFQYSGRTLETRSSLVKNMNPHNTMFAGSIYSQAVLTGWGMIHLHLKEKELSGDIVLSEGDIKYTKPITVRPRAVCNIESMIEKFDLLAKGKRCPVKLQVDIFDDDVPVGVFKGEYWVIPEKSVS
ncbi:YiiD C-terminal domain-containing protein [Neptunicella sp. SCSIO 80796]|uniref:bifunctional GNAT family N-acetyltransferase/hotdog fold thioesterase n=1 Tax=Neptunicella plasticusilytica TaxID=3117012 RepID=UPI003A4E3604